MEKFFPLSFTGLEQRFRRGKRDDKGPGKRDGPIVERLQSRRVIFVQRLAQLADKGGAIANQPDLVAAQQPQFFDPRILRRELLPLGAVETKGVGQAPSVHTVGLVPAGHFALSVGYGALRMHGEDAALQLHQFFNRRAALGFHRECQVWKRGDLLEKVRPALSRMLESEVGHRFARRINDDDVVMIVSPIEAREMSELIPFFHRLLWFGFR